MQRFYIHLAARQTSIGRSQLFLHLAFHSFHLASYNDQTSNVDAIESSLIRIDTSSFYKDPRIRPHQLSAPISYHHSSLFKSRNTILIAATSSKVWFRKPTDNGDKHQTAGEATIWNATLDVVSSLINMTSQSFPNPSHLDMPKNMNRRKTLRQTKLRVRYTKKWLALFMPLEVLAQASYVEHPLDHWSEKWKLHTIPWSSIEFHTKRSSAVAEWAAAQELRAHTFIGDLLIDPISTWATDDCQKTNEVEKTWLSPKMKGSEKLTYTKNIKTRIESRIITKDKTSSSALTSPAILSNTTEPAVKPKEMRQTSGLFMATVRIGGAKERRIAYTPPSFSADAWYAYLLLRNDPERAIGLSDDTKSAILLSAFHQALRISSPELAFERTTMVLKDMHYHKVKLPYDDWGLFLSSLQGWQKLDTIFTSLIPTWGKSFSLSGLRVLLEICTKIHNEFASVTCIDIMMKRIVFEGEDGNSEDMMQMMKACQVFRLSARSIYIWDEIIAPRIDRLFDKNNLAVCSNLLVDYLKALHQIDSTFITPNTNETSPRKPHTLADCSYKADETGAYNSNESLSQPANTIAHAINSSKTITSTQDVLSAAKRALDNFPPEIMNIRKVFWHHLKLLLINNELTSVLNVIRDIIPEHLKPVPRSIYVLLTKVLAREVYSTRVPLSNDDFNNPKMLKQVKINDQKRYDMAEAVATLGLSNPSKCPWKLRNSLVTNSVLYDFIQPIHLELFKMYMRCGEGFKAFKYFYLNRRRASYTCGVKMFGINDITCNSVIQIFCKERQYMRAIFAYKVAVRFSRLDGSLEDKRYRPDLLTTVMLAKAIREMGDDCLFRNRQDLQGFQKENWWRQVRLVETELYNRMGKRNVRAFAGKKMVDLTGSMVKHLFVEDFTI